MKKEYLDIAGLSHFLDNLKDIFASDTHTHSEFNIDYDAYLAFDTSEIVTGVGSTSVLGQAIFGKLVLA